MRLVPLLPTANTFRDDRGSVMPSRVFWNLALLEVAVAMLALIVRYPLEICPDCAANLYYGQLLIQGKLPFVDFVDTDPPLIIYLSAIPAFISRVCDVNPILVFSLGVFLVAVFTSLLSRVLLGLSSMECRTHVSGLFLFVFLALSLLLWICRIDDWGQFGQREHLFVMLYVPFFLVRWLRWEQGKGVLHIGIPAAVLAGVGACVKPHFVLAAAAPEVYWIVMKRNVNNLFKPEAIVFACIGLIYALHFPLLPGSVRNEFFGRWLPFILQKYHAYYSPTSVLVRNPDILFACIMTAAPFVLSWKGGHSASLARPLAIFTGASVVFIHFVQRSGWMPYHAIPAVYGSLLVWSIICGEPRSWSTRWLPQRVGARLLLLVLGYSVVASVTSCVYGFSLRNPLFRTVSGKMAFAIMIAAVTVYLSARIRGYAANRRLDLLCGVGRLVVIAFLGVGVFYAATELKVEQRLSQDDEAADIVLKNTAEGDPILFITSSVAYPFPMMLVLNRHRGSRYLWSFPIHMFYAGVQGDRGFPYHVGEDTPSDEKRFLRELAEDIETFRPRLIFVGDHGGPSGFELVEYLEKIGFMDSAMRGYVKLPRTLQSLVFALPITE